MKLARFVISVLLSVFLLCSAGILYSQQLAFPTAEGSGRFATGGRGGSVYEVTNLSNSGPGSIVNALSSGNRTIVFRVSGTIELGNVILSPKSNTTIAGQTAPGDGICIKGRFNITGSNVVIRYIRVRVDEGGANSDGDAIDIAGGKNIIIDHVSASYARDEGISCRQYGDSITVQWCIISEALTFEGHSFGSLIRGEYGKVRSYHHNLYAHNKGRNPRPGNYTAYTSDPEGLHFDFRNNVVYNWGGSKAGYNADDNTVSRYNFIGNAYIRGVESSGNLVFQEESTYAFGYFKDNMMEGVVPADPWTLVYLKGLNSTQIADYKSRSYEVPMDPVTTTSPEQAKTDVLAFAGASFPKRDIIDSRIVNDVLNKTGHSIASTAEQPEGGWPVLYSLTAPDDSDHDGMPDDWETANGLNNSDPEDRNGIGKGGYTNLEIYLNSLVESPSAFYAPIHFAAELKDITKIEITWEGANENETGFRIERAKGETGNFDTIAEVQADVNVFVDTELEELTLYRYRVSAFNDSLTSGYGGIAWVSTLSTTSLPLAVSDPSPNNNSKNIAVDTTLMWTSSSNADSYDIYLGTENPPPFVINQVETTYKPDGLETGTRYYWRIDGRNSNGTTEGSIWRFTVEGEKVTGLNSVQNETVVVHNFPNPFNESTYIKYELESETQVELSVYNILGREIATLVNQQQTAGEHSILFDAKALENGIYIYILKTGLVEQRGKMLLMKY